MNKADAILTFQRIKTLTSLIITTTLHTSQPEDATLALGTINLSRYRQLWYLNTESYGISQMTSLHV